MCRAVGAGSRIPAPGWCGNHRNRTVHCYLKMSHRTEVCLTTSRALTSLVCFGPMHLRCQANCRSGAHSRRATPQSQSRGTHRRAVASQKVHCWAPKVQVCECAKKTPRRPDYSSPLLTAIAIAEMSRISGLVVAIVTVRFRQTPKRARRPVCWTRRNR